MKVWYPTKAEAMKNLAHLDAGIIKARLEVERLTGMRNEYLKVVEEASEREAKGLPVGVMVNEKD